jgi:hypothetical protein
MFYSLEEMKSKGSGISEREQKLLVALKAVIYSTEPDETGEICITNIEFAIIEANALIWEIEHENN